MKLGFQDLPNLKLLFRSSKHQHSVSSSFLRSCSISSGLRKSIANFVGFFFWFDFIVLEKTCKLKTLNLPQNRFGNKPTKCTLHCTLSQNQPWHVLMVVSLGKSLISPLEKHWQGQMLACEQCASSGFFVCFWFCFGDFVTWSVFGFPPEKHWQGQR